LIFKRRQIGPYFVGSLIDLFLVLLCLVISVKSSGNIPDYMGIFNLLLMAVSCACCVLGMMELAYWKEERRRLGIAGVWIYTFVLLGLIAIYVLGIFFG